jgi:uncharacterized protein (DUF983 family)
MLEEARTFKALDEACAKSRLQVADVPPAAENTFKSWLSCPECGSRLLMAMGTAFQDAKFRCQACGAETDSVRTMEASLEEEHAGATYEAAKDGVEPPVATCPNCLSETFLVHERVCAVCGEGLPHERCNLCGTNLSVEEQDFDGLCSWCSNRLSKDD